MVDGDVRAGLRLEPLMVSPPFPMTLPTSPGGQSTRLVVTSIPAVLCGFGVGGGGASVGEPDARRSSPGATAALTAAAADEGSPGGTGGAGSSVVGAASAGMSFIVGQSRGSTEPNASDLIDDGVDTGRIPIVKKILLVRLSFSDADGSR